MATIKRSRINEIIKEEYEKLIERTGEEHPDSKVSNLIKKYNSTGRVAFSYPKKKTISINGRMMPEKKAIEYMKSVVTEGKLSRGGMKTGETYIQKLSDSDLYFSPTEKTNNGVKGTLFTVYHGKKVAGKNPKSYSVPDTYMDLWSTADNVSSTISSKLK